MHIWAGSGGLGTGKETIRRRSRSPLKSALKKGEKSNMVAKSLKEMKEKGKAKEKNVGLSNEALRAEAVVGLTIGSDASNRFGKDPDWESECESVDSSPGKGIGIGPFVPYEVEAPVSSPEAGLWKSIPTVEMTSSVPFAISNPTSPARGSPKVSRLPKLAAVSIPLQMQMPSAVATIQEEEEEEDEHEGEFRWMMFSPKRDMNKSPGKERKKRGSASQSMSTDGVHDVVEDVPLVLERGSKENEDVPLVLKYGTAEDEDGLLPMIMLGDIMAARKIGRGKSSEESEEEDISPLELPSVEVSSAELRSASAESPSVESPHAACKECAGACVKRVFPSALHSGSEKSNSSDSSAGSGSFGSFVSNPGDDVDEGFQKKYSIHRRRGGNEYSHSDPIENMDATILSSAREAYNSEETLTHTEREPTKQIFKLINHATSSTDEMPPRLFEAITQYASAGEKVSVEVEMLGEESESSSTGDVSERADLMEGMDDGGKMEMEMQEEILLTPKGVNIERSKSVVSCAVEDRDSEEGGDTDAEEALQEMGYITPMSIWGKVADEVLRRGAEVDVVAEAEGGEEKNDVDEVERRPVVSVRSLGEEDVFEDFSPISPHIFDPTTAFELDDASAVAVDGSPSPSRRFMDESLNIDVGEIDVDKKTPMPNTQIPSPKKHLWTPRRKLQRKRGSPVPFLLVKTDSTDETGSRDEMNSMGLVGLGGSSEDVDVGAGAVITQMQMQTQMGMEIEKEILMQMLMQKDEEKEKEKRDEEMLVQIQKEREEKEKEKETAKEEKTALKTQLKIIEAFVSEMAEDTSFAREQMEMLITEQGKLGREVQDVKALIEGLWEAVYGVDEREAVWRSLGEVRRMGILGVVEWGWGVWKERERLRGGKKGEVERGEEGRKKGDSEEDGKKGVNLKVNRTIAVAGVSERRRRQMNLKMQAQVQAQGKWKGKGRGRGRGNEKDADTTLTTTDLKTKEIVNSSIVERGSGVEILVDGIEAKLEGGDGDLKGGDGDAWSDCTSDLGGKGKGFEKGEMYGLNKRIELREKLNRLDEEMKRLRMEQEQEQEQVVEREINGGVGMKKEDLHLGVGELLEEIRNELSVLRGEVRGLKRNLEGVGAGGSVRGLGVGIGMGSLRGLRGLNAGGMDIRGRERERDANRVFLEGGVGDVDVDEDGEKDLDLEFELRGNCEWDDDESAVEGVANERGSGSVNSIGEEESENPEESEEKEEIEEKRRLGMMELGLGVAGMGFNVGLGVGLGFWDWIERAILWRQG